MILPVRSLVCLLLVSLVLGCSRPNGETRSKDPIRELPYQKLSLDGMGSFRAGVGGAWKTAANVSMDRNNNHHADIVNGDGILVFTGAEHPTDVVTNFEYGDIDLKLDFMMGRQALVLLYFQGRYAIQLTDSWLKSDSSKEQYCGSIRHKDGSTTPPRLNASKAPGLWQHLLVKFRAPKFDSSGKVIANARFEEIYLNGKLIHHKIEILDQDADETVGAENKNGPVRISADGGPVAFRNIGYKDYNDDKITLQNIQYSVYKGLYREYDTLRTMTPVRTGMSDSLHWNVGDRRAQISFDGTMEIPADGGYLFKLRAGGPAWLLIDDQEVVDNRFTREYTHAFFGTINLTKGAHAFKLVNANYDESLVVEYEGPHIALTMLTAPTSERKVKIIEPFEYVVKDSPLLQRGFFTHHNKVNTYAMSVGMPNGVNYTYDLSTYNLLALWRDKFIDVSNMWTSRGESQMEIPLGAHLELAGSPPLLELADQEDIWPDTVAIDNSIYTNRGYRLDKNGLPVFFYSYQDVNVEDQLTSHADRSGLVRTITLTFNQRRDDLYFLLGSGKLVEPSQPGQYSIDEKEYFVESIAGTNETNVEIVRSGNGKYQLLLPVSGDTGQKISFNYSIIW